MDAWLAVRAAGRERALIGWAASAHQGGAGREQAVGALDLLWGEVFDCPASPRIAARTCVSSSNFTVFRQVRHAAAANQGWRRSSSGGRQEYRFNVYFHRKKQRGFCSSQRRVDFNYTSSIPLPPVVGWAAQQPRLGRRSSSARPTTSCLSLPPLGCLLGTSEVPPKVCRRPQPSNSMPFASRSLC